MAMTDASLRLCDSEKSNFPRQKSCNLKPLLPKDGEESYFEGHEKKIKNKKKNTKAVSLLSPAQISGQHCWGEARGKDRSATPQESQELSFDYEEIQCLSLEDFQVYKKLVPMRSPVKKPWEKDDFPVLQNLDAARSIKESYLSCSCQRHESSVNGKLKMSECSNRIVARVSTYCQTEDYDGQFRVDVSSSLPDAVLCRKIPLELRGTVMSLISQNHENRSVISLLSCLLYRLMINVLHKNETLDALSASDVQNIESILSDELKGLTSFSSRSVRGQSRSQSLNSCFGTLFSKFPGLQTMPEFSHLFSSCQVQSYQ